MFHADNLSVSLGGETIIAGVELAAAPGAVSVVVGPNGSGKTTLLKAMCRDVFYRGRVTLNGRDLGEITPGEAASQRAVLPQSTALAFPFTVREVVALGVSAGRPGVGRGDLKYLPEWALARVDLDGFAGRFYSELSGGEQQRVQLARVLCQVWEPVLDGVPRYLLLDEPVSSLDIRHQLMIMQVARNFADAGGGVIAVMHDLNLTAMFADHVVVMKNGRVAGAGAPGNVFEDDLIAHTFDCPLKVDALPVRPVPFVLPQAVTH